MNTAQIKRMLDTSLFTASVQREAKDFLGAQAAALEAAREFISEYLSEEYCPNCLNAPEYHDDDCKAGILEAALAALSPAEVTK